MPRRIIGCVQKTVEQKNNAAKKPMNSWFKAAFFFAVLPLLPVRLIKKSANKCAKRGISVCGRFKIGGVNQYISIEGENRGAPLVVFLHGGPALPMRGTDDRFYSLARKKFVCVKWDQRGSGRSEGADEDIETLLRDLDEVVSLALSVSGRKKAWIVGHCWGSVLGLKYAARHSEKVEGYVGVCQFVSGRRSYSRIRKIALEAAAKRGNFDDAVQIKHKFEGLLNSGCVRKTDISDWTGLHALYEKYRGYKGGKSKFSLIADALCSPDFTAEDLYSLISWANVEKSMPRHEKINDECIFKTDFLASPPSVSVPVTFIEAGSDAVTDSGTALTLLAAMNAPSKDVRLIKNSGHNVMLDAPVRLAEELESVVSLGKR